MWIRSMLFKDDGFHFFYNVRVLESSWMSVFKLYNEGLPFFTISFQSFMRTAIWSVSSNSQYRNLCCFCFFFPSNVGAKEIPSK